MGGVGISYLASSTYNKLLLLDHLSEVRTSMTKAYKEIFIIETLLGLTKTFEVVYPTIVSWINIKRVMFIPSKKK